MDYRFALRLVALRQLQYSYRQMMANFGIQIAELKNQNPGDTVFIGQQATNYHKLFFFFSSSGSTLKVCYTGRSLYCHLATTILHFRGGGGGRSSDDDDRMTTDVRHS